MAFFFYCSVRGYTQLVNGAINLTCLGQGLFLLVIFFYNGNGNGQEMCFQMLVQFKIEVL